MNIYVCVGSSCHLKGSYKIVDLLKKEIAQRGLEDKITLSAAFCLGHCTDGVSIKVEDEVVCGVSEANFNEIFEEKVMKRLS